MTSKKSKKIHFVITGGTIDSIWSGAKETVVVSGHSVMPEYFENLERNLKFYEDILFTEVCMKDSRAITTEDRKKMADVIEKSDAKMFIVTHGTYTMPDTARFLKATFKRKDQTIILTGSMVPINGFDFSDGPFNLGYAIAQAQTLPAGVYVTMNAQVFRPDEVAKNIEEGKFYSIFKEQQ